MRMRFLRLCYATENLIRRVAIYGVLSRVIRWTFVGDVDKNTEIPASNSSFKIMASHENRVFMRSMHKIWL